METTKNILLQGLPGIGKTTLIKKIVDKLNEMKIETTGFFTEEKRENSHRIGFDIITLENKRGILARKEIGNNNKLKVGEYVVYITDFEKLILPIFENLKSVVIIDEIGKMELFSKTFVNEVKKLIDNPNVTVIATIPLKGRIPLITGLKENSNCKLFTVNYQNRNELLKDIMNYIDYIIPMNE